MCVINTSGSGITLDVYDITVVSDHTLMNVKRGVVISEPATTVNMGVLLEGNANNDLEISMDDLLLMTSTWLRSPRSLLFNKMADFDRTNSINLYDYEMISGNWQKQSPVEIP